MALTPYQQQLLGQINEGNLTVPQALPGQLSLLGWQFLRDRGIDPSQPSPGYDPSAPDGMRQQNRPPKNYDPNWFKSQGNAPATPSANAAVAAQSQVVRTPQEIQKQYEKAQKSASKQENADQAIMDAWRAYKNGFGITSDAILNELGGRQRVAPAGDPMTEGITLHPGSTGIYVTDPVKASGEAYIGVPKDFQALTPRRQTGWAVDGMSRTPLKNQDYASSLAADIRADMMAGRPIAAGSFDDPLFQRQGVSEAINNWVSGYNTIQNYGGPVSSTGRPLSIGTSYGSSPSAQEQKALTNSWNTYQQQYNSNKLTENQAYLDQMGGGFYGGVVPSANNPQWYDTTPTWGAPQQMGGERAQQQAQNSPWGQPGAPWASQAWASGMYDPSRGPMPAGQDGQIQDRGPQWSGPSGMFAPQQGFNPNLVTNSPWAVPQKQNNAFGATNEGNKMTFGSSPWGSFW
jgi:hypothetical protein